MADWNAGTSAGIGYDQMRGVLAASRARQIGSHIDQGARVTGYTEDGVLIYDGRLSQPPALGQDGLAHIAAQGHGFAATKHGSRIIAKLETAAAWDNAIKSPLNYPPGTAGDLTISVTDTTNFWNFNFASTGTNVKTAAIWAPGCKLTRFRWSSVLDTNFRDTVYSADGPNLAATQRVEFARNGTSVEYIGDVKFKTPGDAVMFEVHSHTGGGTAATQGGVGSPEVWGDVSNELIFSEDGARIVARRMRWDETGIRPTPGAAHRNLDSAGGASAFLGYISALDDARWCVWEDRGNGAILDYGPYGPTWLCSARTGARWQLDPLEVYNRATVQYLTRTLRFAQTTLNADPDPLLGTGIINELKASLADTQFTTDLANTVAWQSLRSFLRQRYRGRIQSARWFEAGTGRPCTYEVRAGGLVNITDFTADGAITLRIAETSMDPTGVTVGIEAPAIPTANFGALGPERGDASMTALSWNPTTGGTGSVPYSVPGGPGAPEGKPFPFGPPPRI